ncbi:2-C-methyl-D-erythritol 4-phosphate cytidylyltransferase [Flexivirga sp. ID2601S]|uniref:2-C-methyl-D-erythritol 4-phosphate cytidylyltransferase n=1 Tax=Flexivirga aerilata TaxID=1656889 RepID=A0A849AF26_9MICO|nr:2-C-methyl-D-erythritol 4-phosphate cytidylyltransferase [Flexivirga aerilata]
MTTNDPGGVSVGIVVVAAGLGTRLGAGMPKALVRIGGRTLVEHAVARAQAWSSGDVRWSSSRGRPARDEPADAGVSRPPSSGDPGWSSNRQRTARDEPAGVGVSRPPATRHAVVVVAPASHLDEFRALAPEAIVVPGGAERTDSVAAGLAALPAEVDIVLVHDAARALAPASLFAAVAAAVADGADAVVPGLPVTDTIKQVDASGHVVATPDRATLRAIQTPQGFTRAALARAHADGVGATDDAALVERQGGRVLVIDGDPRAIKVTIPADLETVDRLLADG